MTLREEGFRQIGLRNVSAGTLVSSRLVHIETQVAKSDSTIDFTNVFTSDYDRYVIFVDNILSSQSQDVLDAQFSSDGGSTWDSGSSDYAWSQFFVREDGTTSSHGSSSTDGILIASTYGSDPSSDGAGGASIIVSNPIESDRATTIRTSDISNSDTTLYTNVTGGIRLAQSAIDSIQFFMDSGNISSGIFSVYGVDQ